MHVTCSCCRRAGLAFLSCLPNPDGLRRGWWLWAAQEAGLKVKEFELLRRNFSDSGNFGALAAACFPSSRCVFVSRLSLWATSRLR